MANSITSPIFRPERNIYNTHNTPPPTCTAGFCGDSSVSSLTWKDVLRLLRAGVTLLAPGDGGRPSDGGGGVFMPYLK